MSVDFCPFDAALDLLASSFAKSLAIATSIFPGYGRFSEAFVLLLLAVETSGTSLLGLGSSTGAVAKISC